MARAVAGESLNPRPYGSRSWHRMLAGLAPAIDAADEVELRPRDDIRRRMLAGSSARRATALLRVDPEGGNGPRIALKIHSSLAAFGLTAAVAASLAEHGVRRTSLPPAPRPGCSCPGTVATKPWAASRSVSRPGYGADSVRLPVCVHSVPSRPRLAPRERDRNGMRQSEFDVTGACRLTLLLALFVVINYVDRGAIGIAAPKLKAGARRSTIEQFGLAVSAFAWIYAPAQFFDRLVDVAHLRLPADRRWLVLVGVRHLRHRFVGGLAALVTMRFLLGIGEGVAFPCASKIIASARPAPSARRRQRRARLRSRFGPGARHLRRRPDPRQLRLAARSSGSSARSPCCGCCRGNRRASRTGPALPTRRRKCPFRSHSWFASALHGLWASRISPIPTASISCSPGCRST